MNKIIVIGNLTKKLELRSTQTGKLVTTLSVAINNGKLPNGEQDTTFLDFGVFGAVAENCVKYLGKGSKVAIEGLVKNNSYEKNGVKVNTYQFIANNVEFLNTKSSNTQSATQKEVDPYKEFGEVVEIDDSDLPF